MEPLTEGPTKAGSRMRLSFGSGPFRATLILEMVAVEPSERLAFTTVSQGGIQWDGEYRLAPADQMATRLSQQGTLRFQRFVAAIRADRRRRDPAGRDRRAREAEGDPGAAPALKAGRTDQNTCNAGMAASSAARAWAMTATTARSGE
jgi:hypothetical protein